VLTRLFKYDHGLNFNFQEMLDQATDPWGVDVERVEM